MNLAVNNLLSRDEDDGDDDENPEYLPGGETVYIQLYSCGINKTDFKIILCSICRQLQDTLN